MTLLLFFLLFGGAVDVVAATDCPSQDDVASALARLASATSASSSEERDRRRPSAEIRWVGESLSISLHTPDGKLAAARTLAHPSRSCRDLAEAAAVVIAVWEGETRADLGPDLPASRPQSPPDVATARAIQGMPMTERSRPWEVGVSVLAAQAIDLAPGLGVETQVGQPSSPLAARLGFALTRAHALALGESPGRSLWSRAALALGLRDRAWIGSSALDGHVDVATALIRIEGAGFGENYSRSGFDLGVGAGVRWARAIERVAPFVALDGAVWPSRQFVSEQGTGALARLPTFELRAAIGLSYGRFR